MKRFFAVISRFATRVFKKIRQLTQNTFHTRGRKSYHAYPGTSRVRYNRNARRKTSFFTIKLPPIFKNKYAVGGMCGLVVIAAVVLALTLPPVPDKAMASVADSILPADKVIDSAADSEDLEMVALDQSGSIGQISALSGDSLENEGIPATVDTPLAEPSATTEPEKTELVPGCHDPQIIEIQQRLMDLGYMDNDEPTDYYGKGTEYALQLFQRSHSLQIDGILGEQTMTMLFSSDAKPYVVQVGDKGTDVSSIQSQLRELKYLKTRGTGYFGTETEAAVKSFQQRNGLSADGKVGEYTREVLYSDDAKPAKTSSGSSKSGGSSSGHSSSGGSKSGGNSAPPVGDPDSASADRLIEVAKSFLGTEYTRGGKGPNEFDCSGFVYYCLNASGYNIKYMTSGGWAGSGFPKISSMSDLKRGDIICFRKHVGIYMGDGQMIHASSSSDKVVISSNIFKSSYWTKNFKCGRRVF